MDLKLIVALDFHLEKDVLSFVDALDPTRCAVKVGLELFTLLGRSLVRLLIERHFKVFLDLKFHDIPNTVAQACKVGADLGVWMMNVHAAGGYAMMEAAQNVMLSYGPSRPLLVAVTVLTSLNALDLPQIGVASSLQNQVENLALLAQQAGLDGVVCSAHEVATIKARCGKQFVAVTPGLRLAEDAQHDQKRVQTPQAALRAGSDYLVIGRSITQAPSPARVIENLLQQIG